MDTQQRIAFYPWFAHRFTRSYFFVYCLIALCLSSLCLPRSLSANEADLVKIGVLSHRGDSATLKTWEPTARYLNQAIDGFGFRIIPLDFESIQQAVESAAIDFVLTNSGIYVNLEALYRVSRLATMSNRRAGGAYNLFGGVVFTRADRNDIRHLTDLKRKTFVAVDENSLGGFQMAWRALNQLNINPYHDFNNLSFLGTHDKVVMTVLNGEADAGTVRTDILERMAAAGRIQLEDVFILNRHTNLAFPFVHSTKLYPEWPFSKLQHTSNQLAQKVAIALLQMPANHQAALSGDYSGWTIPLEYQPVHSLFKELNLPPYTKQEFTFLDVFQRYWYWLLTALFLLSIMGIITSAVIRRNERLEASRQSLQKRYELILNSVADGIYGVDTQGNATFVNRAMEDITGWTAEDLIGKNQHDLLHHTHPDGSHHPCSECPVFLSAKDEKSRYIEDDVFWCKNGERIWVDYSATPVRDANKQTVGSVVVFRDISKRKQTEDELRDREAQLNHVARLSTLGEMLSGISHELNQPLTAITTNSRACIRMLESGQEGIANRCADTMEKIAAQAERAGEVIRQIRHFVSKEMPDRKPVRVQRMLDIVVELMQSELRRQNIKLKIDLSSPQLRVCVQDIQIEQVILNLVRNAVEALSDNDEDNKQVTISAMPTDNGMVEIAVSDNGCGMSDYVLEHLFEPFVTTKAKGQGMGLGLSISEGIVRAHGSRLQVDAVLDVGTTFTFEVDHSL